MSKTKPARKARSLEERELFYKQKLNDLAIKKQIASLRQQLNGKSAKKQ